MNKVAALETFFDKLSNIKRLMHQHSSEGIDQRMVTMFQIQALSILSNNNDITPSKLGENLCVSSSSTAQLIDRLISSGWVNRTHDEQDRRVVHLELTQTGHTKLKELQKTRHEQFSQIADFISEDDLTKLVEIMTAFYEKMESNMKGTQK